MSSLLYSKVGCVFPMVVDSLLFQAEFGPNDHQEDATHFNSWSFFQKLDIISFIGSNLIFPAVEVVQIRFTKKINEFFCNFYHRINREGVL